MNDKNAVTLLSQILSKRSFDDNKSSFHRIHLYGNVAHQRDTETSCKIFHITSNTGIGAISQYQVFTGVELFYNDIHAAYCNKEQSTAKNINGSF